MDHLTSSSTSAVSRTESDRSTVLPEDKSKRDLEAEIMQVYRAAHGLNKRDGTSADLGAALQSLCQYLSNDGTSEA